MVTRTMAYSIILATSAVFLPAVHAEPSVSIIMEKTTYSYCEKLFYIIKVSEITGEPAIIHIRDEAGKASSAIPIPITNLQNPVPSLFAFEAETYPLGKYFIDVEYSGAVFTSEFDLIDSDTVCIPNVIKQFMIEWLNGKVSDGHLIDVLQKYTDRELIDIPFEINERNIHRIDIPDWVKNVGYWWIEGTISDRDFAQGIGYLVEKNIVFPPTRVENEV